MKRPFLIDTHVFISWRSDRIQNLTHGQAEILSAPDEHQPFLVSDFTLAEIANLYASGRLKLDRPVRAWIEKAALIPEVEWLRISPAVAAEMASLSPTFHRDPGDRIIVATARIHGATILTSDALIVKSGLVPCID